MQTHKSVLLETPAQEHDRLRAQRERIAAIYGHAPKRAASVAPLVPVTVAPVAPRAEVAHA